MNALLKKGYLSLVYFLLYAPLCVLMAYSVNNARFSMQWHGFSMHWYHELMHDNGLWVALFHSACLGLSASLIATLAGLMACIYLFLNHDYRRHASFYNLILLLIVLPDLVLGIALLIFFNVCKMPLGFLSLLIAHITFCLPFVVLTLNSRIHTLDATLYDSAQDLGASPVRAFTKVLLPLLWPALSSAFLLCFTLSFDDVIISYFVSGSDFNILPLTIYSLVKAGVTPELNALCTVTFLMSMALVMLAHRLGRRSS